MGAAGMSKSDDDDRPNVNTGNEWSEMDLFDLANEIRLNQSIEFIADFLCRSPREVNEKIAELERSGELQRLITWVATRIADAG
jgi:hypothetical protein